MAMTFSKRWVRRVFVSLLIAACVIGLASLLTWLAHARPLSAASPAAATEALPAIPTLAFRIEQLERSLDRVRAEHDRMIWLLIANLAGATGSLATYILTNRRRFFNGPEGRP